MLVTGGAGFIGSHLVEHLLGAGHPVTVVDDLSSGACANLPDRHAGLEVVQAHVGRADGLLDRLVAEAAVVCHLASAMGVRRAHQQPFETAENILRAGLEVTQACAAHRRPLLFLSSSEVYGGVGRVEASEDASLDLGTEPRYSYAAAKLAVEHLVLGLHRSWGVPSWVVRPFNVVGPRQSPAGGHVLPSFVAAALTGQDLLVHGDGLQRRTFLHVGDFVQGVLAVLGSPSLVARPVNLGGHESSSVLALAELVLRTVGGSSSVRHRTHEQVFGAAIVDPRDRHGSADLLRSLTGWTPLRSLEDAVRDAADWMRPRLKPNPTGVPGQRVPPSLTAAG